MKYSTDKTNLQLDWFELLDLKVILEKEIEQIEAYNKLPFIKEEILPKTSKRYKQIMYKITKLMKEYD